MQAICMPVRKACSRLTFELQDQHSYTQPGKVKNLHTTIQQVRLFHSNWAACKKTRSCPNISNNKITTRLFFLWTTHSPSLPPQKKTHKINQMYIMCLHNYLWLSVHVYLTSSKSWIWTAPKRLVWDIFFWMDILISMIFIMDLIYSPYCVKTN